MNTLSIQCLKYTSGRAKPEINNHVIELLVPVHDAHMHCRQSNVLRLSCITDSFGAVAMQLVPCLGAVASAADLFMEK